jgi:translation initiation factor IF-2
MAHHHKETHSPAVTTGKAARDASPQETRPKLEVVLKCDSEGSLEAAAAAISGIAVTGVDISIIGKGPGSVTKSDVFLAETAGRLIAGFQVDVLPGVERTLRERNVEVRLYSVIYTLTDDLKTLAESILPSVPGEQIIGSAKVIVLFKSSRKGIIPGCEVLEGHLAVGQHFRIISAMGPVYSGTIESLHIGDHAVQTAVPGQRVGIRIRNFNRVKVGDVVESYRAQKKVQGWRPAGGIIRK